MGQSDGLAYVHSALVDGLAHDGTEKPLDRQQGTDVIHATHSAEATTGVFTSLVSAAVASMLGR
jgi:hypothetical protein